MQNTYRKCWCIKNSTLVPKMGQARLSSSFHFTLLLLARNAKNLPEMIDSTYYTWGSYASFNTTSYTYNLAAFIFRVLITLLCTSNRRLVEEEYLQKSISTVVLKGTSRQNNCLSNVGNTKGIKLYLQNKEDGILLQTLRSIEGYRTKEYFEFGSKLGIKVNTHILRDLYV